MRITFLFFALIFVLSCRKDNPGTTVAPVEELNMPIGINGLTVKGVDKSGILFVDLKESKFFTNPRGFQITLPSDYQYGEDITLYFSMKEGYSLKINQDIRIDTDGITLSYEGRFFKFNILSPENEVVDQVNLYVDPTRPLEAFPGITPHNLTISPGSLLTSVRVKN